MGDVNKLSLTLRYIFSDLCNVLPISKSFSGM